MVPAAQRAISHARAVAERRRQDAQVAQLARLLRMLKGVNEVVIRGRDRSELLAETCRLAVSLGGYAVAIAATRSVSATTIRAVASNGIDEEMSARLTAYVEESSARPSSAISGVFRTGKAYVINDTAGQEGSQR